MKLSQNIDLGKSLRQVFGDDPDSVDQVEESRARQEATTNAILERFLHRREGERRELAILADEVGLGKTYVALAVAVSLLDAIRNGETPDGLPSNKPVVLVLTPTNDALFNKWMREAEAFKSDCARTGEALDWLEIRCPISDRSKSGNILDLATQLGDASRKRPMLMIAKHSVLGAALNDRDWWRIRALYIVFRHFNITTEHRRWWCRRGRLFDSLGVPELPELIDFRRSGSLWDGEPFPNLESVLAGALSKSFKLAGRLGDSLGSGDAEKLKKGLDNLTRRAIAHRMPKLPLVIIDEVHNLKNEHVQARRLLEGLLTGRVCRLLGLSATPFQLRQDELLSILKLRGILALPNERHAELDIHVDRLAEAMTASRDSGNIFRRRWRALRPRDKKTVDESWPAVSNANEADRPTLAKQVRPPRIAHALETALELEQLNLQLQKHLHPFVIRHQHVRGYREHFIGRNAEVGRENGSFHFSWAPGLEVRGDDELVQYLMMRAVALAKDEKGLPGLGAELTGSYRHLVETAAVWKRLENAKNPLLQDYRAVLNGMIGPQADGSDADREHRKVQATALRALDFFKQGQKSLIFCVFTKTAETIRDQVQAAIDGFLSEVRLRVFGGEATFENFRKRFFNRRERLFSLIQDHPLLGQVQDGRRGIPGNLKLSADHLREIAELLVARNESAGNEKPDRRLLLAATEHVALKVWRKTEAGERWLAKVLANCPELGDRIFNPSWLEAREPLSRSELAGRVRRAIDPEATGNTEDPLDVEQFDEESRSGRSNTLSERDAAAWVRRLSQDAVGEMIAPYFRLGVIDSPPGRPPLLAEHHGDLLAKFDLDTRAVAGQVFRRTLMAEEFLLRYLADVERDNTEKWADYLAERYLKPLDGHLETLKDRVHAYLETLLRAKNNKALLAGYNDAAENRNVVQLVKGGTQNRDRYFLGFNTPYRPEVLISTSVGQEGIDLHRECRHVIHHDLCWNPATIEQRTGRVDRIGSKVERERLGANGELLPTLEIAVPYLAATYDERMFEELYRRAQLFEVTLGGDMRVEGRIEAEQVEGEKKQREKAGIGTEDEDLGAEGEYIGSVDLPMDMVERLRVDLSVWRPT